MKKHLLFLILSQICFLGYSQNYTWPIAGKNAGDDIIYKPQSYLDGKLLYDDLIIRAESGTPVVAPVDGKITSYNYTYQDAYQRMTTFGLKPNYWHDDSLSFAELGNPDIKHIMYLLKLLRMTAETSGFRDCDLIRISLREKM